MNKLKNLNYLGTRIEYEVNSKNFFEIYNYLIQKGGSKIYTVNPEFIVDAYFDINFRKELNSSDLNVIDGVGLLYGIKKYFKNIFSTDEIKNLKTFPGVDLVNEVLGFANKNKNSLFVLGGSDENNVAEKTINYIKRNFPNIKIVGGTSKFKYTEEDDKDTIKFIKECLKVSSLDELDIIFVGYGHKKQEFWIGRNSSKIPARLSIGVGGTLDYLSGNIKRAPIWFRNFGLEWLYRFFRQPLRILRVIKATVIFSYLSKSFINAFKTN